MMEGLQPADVDHRRVGLWNINSDSEVLIPPPLCNFPLTGKTKAKHPSGIGSEGGERRVRSFGGLTCRLPMTY